MKTAQILCAATLCLISLMLPCAASQDNIAQSTVSASDTPSQFSNADDRFDFGILWRVENGYSNPSFLLGTMHVEDPRVTKLPVPVQQAFDQSRSLTTEALLDLEQILQVGLELLLMDGDSLQDLIGDRLYAEVTSALRSRGLMPEAAALLKPWAVALLLSQPKPQTGVFLDRKLYQQAQQSGKEVYGLETLEEQLTIFNVMDLEDQITLLEETLLQTDMAEQLLEDLTQAYLARDIGQLRVLANEQFSASPVQQGLKQQLLLDRNARMVDRMRIRLDEGNAFIAIGALHLPGPDGVLRLLERIGYRVSKIY